MPSMIADESRANRAGDYGTRNRAALCSHQLESHTSLHAGATDDGDKNLRCGLRKQPRSGQAALPEEGLVKAKKSDNIALGLFRGVVVSSFLFCAVCGASLRNSQGRCVNGCCWTCHKLYCGMPEHKLDVEKSRDAEGARLVTALRESLAPPGAGV
jgi:hypothetical protein